MGTGSAAAALNHNSKDVVENAIANALQVYHVSENMYSLQNQFLVFIGEKK